MKKPKKSSKNIARKIIEALREKAPLNNNRGDIEHTPRRWASRKDRKASGWITPKLVHPQMKYKDIIAEGLEPEKFYDEWASYKDGSRNWKTIEEVEKTKKEIIIRKAKLKKLKNNGI